MTRWQCKNDRCNLIIDNGNVTRIEDSIKEITQGAEPCPVCESTEGWENLDYQSPIFVPEIEV